MKTAADLTIRIVATAPGTAEAFVSLDPEFAGFAGHFPGAPVLPGMCQIDLVLRAASLALDAPLELVAVDRARFVRRTLPGEEMRIRLAFEPDSGASTSVAADLSVAGEPVAELRLVVTRRAESPAPR